MKTKGFTLIELLVVISVIALLMGILMPALARVRQLAIQLLCGSRLYGIGHAVHVYANDYEDQYPRAGPANATWPTQTITSSLYLLVRGDYVSTKQFMCRADAGAAVFKAPDYSVLRDFGDQIKNCSYSYHYPYGQFGLTGASEPQMAVAADRNPWYDPSADQNRWNDFDPAGADSDRQKAGNAQPHQINGQNVLFVDGHVDFEKRSYCAMNDDNIYTIGGTAPAHYKGTKPVGKDVKPAHTKDSLLISEGSSVPVQPVRPRPPIR